MTPIQFVMYVSICFSLLSIGVLCLVWPKRVQEYAFKHCSKYYFWPNPFLGWMKTPEYVLYLRFMGAFFFVPFVGADSADSFQPSLRPIACRLKRAARSRNVSNSVKLDTHPNFTVCAFRPSTRHPNCDRHRGVGFRGLHVLWRRSLYYYCVYFRDFSLIAV